MSAADTPPLPCPPAIPRVVLDTNVWLDLLVFADPRSEALMAALRSGELQAMSRADCDEEWQRVLAYPKLGLSPQQAAGLVSERRQLCCDLVAPSRAEGLPRCRDADDQKFVELALQAQAQLLLSRDKALLRMDARLRRLFGLRVMSDAREALTSLVCGSSARKPVA